MITTTAYFRQHFRQRARQRLGVKLTRNVAASIRAAILRGRAVRLGHECRGSTRAVYMVDVLGRTCRVVFCHRRNELITVMCRGRTV